MTTSDENTSIRNCIWGFKCQETWESLSETDDDDVRFCSKCQKEVFHCTDDDSLVNSIARNRCIAIDPKTFIGNRMLVEEIQMGFIALKAE
jgi:hypothetical protein